MDPKFFGLNQKIGTLVKVPADQGRIVALAVAMASAAHSRLPSSPVENLLAFYGEQVHPVVMENISDVNESIVFAAKQALEYVQIFWKMRYYAAFPAQFVEATAFTVERQLQSRVTSQMDLTTIWTGGLLEISEELNKFMNTYRIEIATLAADITRLMAPASIGSEGGEVVRG